MKITDEKKQLIIQLSKDGLTQKKIAELVNVSVRSIANILKNDTNKYTLENRISKLEKQMDLLLEKIDILIKSNPNIILKQNNINTSKISNDMLSSKNKLINMVESRANF